MIWLVEETRYTCGTELVLGEQEVRCGRPEEYRAKDNRGKHAHLCGDCWALLGYEAQTFYEKLDRPKAKVRAPLMFAVSHRGEVMPFGFSPRGPAKFWK